MSLPSPLGQLLTVLADTQALAQHHKQLLRQNAQATQAALVEPVLRALGWNCNDPRYVQRNLIFQEIALDYALYDDEARICALIKVVALGQQLHNEQLLEQLQVFAQFQDIELVILTNGSDWQFFRPGEEGFLEFITALPQPRQSSERFAQSMIELLDICHFWSFQQSDQLTKLAQLVDQLQNELYVLRYTSSAATPEQRTSLPAEVEESAPKSTEPSAEPKEGRRHRRRQEANQTESRSDFADLTFIPLQELGNIQGKKPQALRLPSGETRAINSWRELLLTSCLHTLQHRPDLAIPFPDKAGRTTQLINTVPPKEGRAFEKIEHRGNTVYIFMNYDSFHHVQNSIHILEQLPDKLKKVEPAIALRDD